MITPSSSRALGSPRYLVCACLAALATTWGCRSLADFERAPAATSSDADAGESAAPETPATVVPDAMPEVEEICVLGSALVGTCYLAPSRP
jgi:hypothetical protein